MKHKTKNLEDLNFKTSNASFFKFKDFIDLN